jgi:hypothetical protein
MPKNGTGRARRETAKPTEPDKSNRSAQLPKLGIKKKIPVGVKRSKSGSRVLQQPKRAWYKPLSWRHRPPVPDYKPLPKARKLFWTSVKLLWANKKLFAGIVLIYGILNLILVRGLAGSTDLSSLKSALDSGLGGIVGRLATTTVSFGYLLVTSGNNKSATSGVYQSILLVVCSLAFIWALRSVLSNQKPRVKDSFYRGMYPLVPFVLIFLLISTQLIPLVVGGFMYGIVNSLGLSQHWWESMLWLLLFIVLTIWSFRMITASIFALYIVTLPDMTPMRAYRSARQLVYGRRLLIWRKFIFLPVALLVCATVIEIPLILIITPVAEWMFFVISMVSMPIVHAYLYNLYRDML